jgi:hypothetical protein
MRRSPATPQQDFSVRPARTVPKLGRAPHYPWGSVRGVKTSVPSPVLSPGRRGFSQARGAHPFALARAYQACPAPQCGQDTVVETDAANTNPQEHV